MDRNFNKKFNLVKFRNLIKKISYKNRRKKMRIRKKSEI